MMFLSGRRHFCKLRSIETKQSKLLYGAADKLSILPKAVGPDLASWRDLSIPESTSYSPFVPYFPLFCLISTRGH